jgi:hypothetical protein
MTISRKIMAIMSTERLSTKRLLFRISIMFIVIALFLLSLNTALPITIDQTPEFDLRDGSLGFVYPLLEGFYAVEDWEVAVCLNEKYKEQLEQEETKNAVNDMIAKDYGGLVVTVSAKVEKGVFDPKNIGEEQEKTNRYMICYGIMPTSEDDADYSLFLKQGSNVESIVTNGKAVKAIGAGGCEVKYINKDFCQVYIKVMGSELFYPIMDVTDPDAITENICT